MQTRMPDVTKLGRKRACALLAVGGGLAASVVCWAIGGHLVDQWVMGESVSLPPLGSLTRAEIGGFDKGWGVRLHDITEPDTLNGIAAFLDARRSQWRAPRYQVAPFMPISVVLYDSGMFKGAIWISRSFVATRWPPAGGRLLMQEVDEDEIRAFTRLIRVDERRVFSPSWG